MSLSLVGLYSSSIAVSVLALRNQETPFFHSSSSARNKDLGTSTSLSNDVPSDLSTCREEGVTENSLSNRIFAISKVEYGAEAFSESGIGTFGFLCGEISMGSEFSLKARNI